GEVLYRWYQEGLNAFIQTCPAGHQVFVNSQHELQRFLDDPSLSIDDFLIATAKMHAQFDLALQQGRDRLLEINSCRPALAAELADQAAEREYEVDIFNFMEQIYDCYGVDSEIRGHQAWVLTPGDNMLTKMPGLPDDGMTVTYNRNVALANEDLHFLSWEHPFVRNSMDMILSSEFGNTALIAVQYPGVRPGSLLAECQFLVDYSNQGKMNSERYFPNSSIRIVIDEAGNHHQDKINFATIPREIQRVHVDTATKVVKARQSELTDMLARAEIAANGQVPGLVNEARLQGKAVLGREVDRLVALQKVNPGVRSEEIDFFKDQLALFNDSLSHARVRLDAVRVMVAL
ncbi:MAG: ATP-dependent helicase HepA, partial [Gammaproteobacteria bacterium]